MSGDMSDPDVESVM